MMAWVDALKKYAEMKGTKYRIPKKGTAEYDEVKKLQMKGKGGLTKGDVSKMVSEMKREESGKAPRKPRSDKGKKRGVASLMGSDTSKMLMEVEKKVSKRKAPAKKAEKKKRMRKSTLAGIVGDTAREMMSVESSLPAKKMRKVRSDKGKKRGKRTGIPKDMANKSGKTLQFDEEGNIM